MASAASRVQPPRKRERREELAFFGLEQLVRPFDRCAQRALAVRRVARAAREERESLLEPLEQLARGKGLHASRGELERERQVVEAAADFRDCLVDLEVGLHRTRPRGEEADRLRVRERRNGVCLLGGEAERLAARHEQLERRAAREDIRELVSRREHVLEVVEEKKQLLVGDVLGEPVVGADRTRGAVQNERGIAKGHERDPVDPIRVAVRERGSGLQRQARLTGAASADEGEEAGSRRSDERHDLPKLPLAPEERRGRHREVGLVERLQPGELAFAELEDALGGREVLQPVVAEVAEAVEADERRRGGRDENLPAVSRSGDSRRAVDVGADVALLRDVRRARVDADAYPDRPGRELLRHLAGCGKRSWRGREGDEEGVALRVHFNAAVPRERIPDDAAVLGERSRVAHGTQLVQQPGRPLHVREEKRDRSPREIRTHDDERRRHPDSDQCRASSRGLRAGLPRGRGLSPTGKTAATGPRRRRAHRLAGPSRRPFGAIRAGGGARCALSRG